MKGLQVKELDVRRCKNLTDMSAVLTMPNLEVQLRRDAEGPLGVATNKTLQTIEADAFPGEGSQGVAGGGGSSGRTSTRKRRAAVAARRGPRPAGVIGGVLVILLTLFNLFIVVDSSVRGICRRVRGAPGR